MANPVKQLISDVILRVYMANSAKRLISDNTLCLYCQLCKDVDI